MSLKHRLRPAVEVVAPPVLAVAVSSVPRTISCMMRIRNEEQYLATAVESVVDLFDEIVLVDNGSTDGTASIIAGLVAARPEKLVAFRYDHVVARSGAENRALAAEPGGSRSPRLLANYYNWCVARCRSGYIAKWDADMVATSAAGPAVAGFRSSRDHVLYLTGVNLHESRTCAIGGRPLEDHEPRVFPKRFAVYDNGFVDCERLMSPFDRFGRLHRVETPVYVHLKYCKDDRFANVSADQRADEEALATAGPPLDDDVLQTIARWGL